MKIVILSRNPELYSTKRLVETAEKKGHKIEVIDHLKCNILIEKHHPAIFYKGRLIKGIDAIIPRIGASVTFYGAAVIRQFEMQKVFSTVPSLALMRSRDKLRSLQIMSRAGLGLPKTVFANHVSASEDILKAVGGAPVVIKLLEGTQGLGVVLAENKQAAMSVIDAFHNLKARIIVQEFIKEAKGADIRAFVVDGKVIGAMKRQALDGEFRSNLHLGGTSGVIKLRNEERLAAVKAAKSMGLSVAGVDMVRSSRGPLILEVNSSPGLKGIEAATGLDIAESIINYVEKYALKKKMKKDTVNA